VCGLREAVQRGRLLTPQHHAVFSYSVAAPPPRPPAALTTPPAATVASSGSQCRAPAYLSNFVAMLLRAEPTNELLLTGNSSLTRTCPPPGGGPGLAAGIEGVCELAARLLFGAVDWARNIPLFPDLRTSDQVAHLVLRPGHGSGVLW